MGATLGVVSCILGAVLMRILFRAIVQESACLCDLEINSYHLAIDHKILP